MTEVCSNPSCNTEMQASTHLCELLLLQFPFLDAVVSRSTEQHVSLHSQTLDAVIMWRLKVMSWTYVSQSSLCHIKHLTGKETFVCIFDLSGDRQWYSDRLRMSGVCFKLYLDIMIFGASDYLIFAQQRLPHSETHDRADVACQLPHRLHPTHKPKYTNTTSRNQNKVKQRSVKFIIWTNFEVSLNNSSFSLTSEVKLQRRGKAMGRNEMFNTFIFHFWGVLMHH